MEHCTFKPQTLGYEGSAAASRVEQRDALGNLKRVDKNTELYQKAKSNKEKKDKSTNDYEFERNQAECTFKPQINQHKKAEPTPYNSNVDSEGIATSQETQNIRGFQVTMARLAKGREDREKFKHATSRGIPGTERDDSKFEQWHFNTNQGKYKPSFNELGGGKSGPQQQYASKLSESKSSDNLQQAKKLMRKKQN